VPVELLKKRFAGKVKLTSLRVIDGEPAGSGLRSWYGTYCTLQWAEIWSSLGAWIEETKPTFGPGTTTSFGATKSLDRRKIQDAARQRERYCRRLRDFLGPTDLLCIPTTPAFAPVKGTIGTDRRTSSYYVNTLSLTAVAGLGRLPQVTLPLGEASGVPVGLSLLAAYGEDAFLLGTAHTVAAHIQASKSQ
jgi:amidase